MNLIAESILIEGNDASELRFVPGNLNTALHETAIQDAEASYSRNVTGGRRIWEATKRYLQWQPSPDASGVSQGMGYGIYGSSEKYFAVRNNNIYSVPASRSNPADAVWAGAFNGATSAWSLVGGTIGAGFWHLWQYGPNMYACNAAGGVKYWPIAGGSLQTLYRDYNSDASQGISSVALEILPATPPADTITFSAPTAGTVVNPDITSDGGIEWTASGADGQMPEGNVTITYATPLDISTIDTLVIYCRSRSLDVDSNPRVVDGKWPVNIFTDAAPLVAIPATNIKITGWQEFEDGNPYPGYETTAVWVDLSGIARATRASIKKIRLGYYIRCEESKYLVRFEPIYKAGNYLTATGAGDRLTDAELKTTSARDIKYACRITNGATTQVIDLGTLAASSAVGPITGADTTITLPRRGTRERLAYTADSGTFPTATVEFYRRDPDDSPSNRYRLIATTGTPTGGAIALPAYVAGTTNTFTDYFREHELPTTTADLTFTTYDPQISGGVTDIGFACAWKGCNVYFATTGASAGKAYFSRKDVPTEVVWDGEPIYVADDDLTIPRTLYVADNQGLPVITAVPQSSLYMFTAKEAYAMSGQTAATATLPFCLPGARGALGPHASCKMGNGALFASDTGLFYIEVPDTFQGTAGEVSLTELTINNPAEYLSVINNGTALSSETSVCTYDEVILVACGTHALMIDTKRQTFSSVEWQGSNTGNAREFADVYADPKRGIVAQLGAGQMGVLGAYPTDNGTNLAGDNGSPVTWTWRSKKMLLDVIATGVIVRKGDGTVNVLVKSSRTPAGQAVVFNDTKSNPQEPIPGGRLSQGVWVQIEVSAIAPVQCHAVSLTVAPGSVRRKINNNS